MHVCVLLFDRIVDRVMPGAVDWKKLTVSGINNIKKRSNCE